MKAVFKNSMGLDMFEATQLAKTRQSPRDAHHGYKAVVEVEEEEDACYFLSFPTCTQKLTK